MESGNRLDAEERWFRFNDGRLTYTEVREERNVCVSVRACVCAWAWHLTDL